jgi:hypothetical protein
LVLSCNVSSFDWCTGAKCNSDWCKIEMAISDWFRYLLLQILLKNGSDPALLILHLIVKMKLFSITTAFIISSVGATQVASEPVTKRSALNMFVLESGYIWNYTKSLFLPAPKCTLSGAKLTVPEPEKEGIVEVSEAAYNFASAGEFYKALQERTALEVVFHPSALYYLSRLESGKILTNLKTENIEGIIYALMMRAKTLSKTYSPAYVNKAYFDCMIHIWGILTENGSEKPEAWAFPCNSAAGCGSEAKTNFMKAAFSFKACKKVMIPQIKALANILDGAIAKEALLKNSASNVREALKRVVIESRFTNNLVLTGVFSLQELTAASAVEKINEALTQLAGIEESREPYQKAKLAFEQKSKEIEDKRASADGVLAAKIVENTVAAPIITQEVPERTATKTSPEISPTVSFETSDQPAAQTTSAGHGTSLTGKNVRNSSAVK